MASLFGHALASIAIGKVLPLKTKQLKFWLLAILCSILPDADVISFKFGIPYASFWGHRGFTHSFVFALLIGILFSSIFYKSNKRNWHLLLFFLATASHPLLDALTNGGLGVAFFAPFDNSRYFFPWRPIQVSPIGIRNFFSIWGLRVIKSELLYIGLPSFILIGIIHLKKKFL